jgi:ArsR family metal-binding transcriptional regulator
MTLNPRVNPIATPANGAMLKFLAVVVANTTYTKVNVITVSNKNALITLFSDGKVTLAEFQNQISNKLLLHQLLPQLFGHNMYNTPSLPSIFPATNRPTVTAGLT